MSRNRVFCKLILDLLSDGRRLRTREIYPLAKARLPEWCVDDWKKGVQGALKFLKDRNRITSEPSPESIHVYIYYMAPNQRHIL